MLQASSQVATDPAARAKGASWLHEDFVVQGRSRAEMEIPVNADLKPLGTIYSTKQKRGKALLDL